MEHSTQGIVFGIIFRLGLQVGSEGNVHGHLQVQAWHMAGMSGYRNTRHETGHAENCDVVLYVWQASTSIRPSKENPHQPFKVGHGPEGLPEGQTNYFLRQL